MKNILTVGLSFLVSITCAFAGGDSPWLEITEKLETAIASNKTSQLEKILESDSPGAFWKNLSKEATETKLTSLWGRSHNFDEMMKAEIVAPETLDLLFEKFSVVKREGRIVHAGVEHTYGYLFSNLKTSFGYKRARWVDSDIQKGFSLPTGILSPLTTEGTLFSNVTYFFGRIAFENEKSHLEKLEADRTIPAALKNFPYSTLKAKRLVETVFVPKADGSGVLKTVEIRTDFVPFTGEKGANSVLLIYSILDSKVGHPVLISGFPVAQGFMDGVLDSKGLGTNQSVKTRYNAFIEDFTTTINGTREVLSIHESIRPN